jgi:transposase
MIKVDQYQLIRSLYSQKGLSQREIAKRLGISRNTVKKYCKGEHPPFKKATRNRKRTVITPEVESFIMSCLKEDDEERIAKQKHTAKRIYDRLVQELGFAGGESTVSHFVKELKEKPAEAFVPLEFDPGEAIQVDWGKATVYLNGRRTTVHLFCGRLCYSAMPFVVAFPHERLEALLEGHIEMFEFFGGVPRRLIYDNTRTAVQDGWGKYVRKLNEHFRQLIAHYATQPEFCNPGQAHEKGLVEGLIRWFRQNILVPIPRVNTYEELNQLFLERCLAYQAHKIRGRGLTVGEHFAIERDKLMPLPLRRMEPIRQVIARCNTFSTVRFDTNRYSVPVEYVGKEVTVKAGVFEVSLWYRGKQIANHPRLYGREGVQYKLEHYLPLLEKKPRAVWNAQPVRAINLPDAFWDFARRLPSDYEVVKLLKLLPEYGISACLEGIEAAASVGAYAYEAVRSKLEQRQHPSPPAQLLTNPIQIKQVDLSTYDAMLEGGEVL